MSFGDLNQLHVMRNVVLQAEEKHRATRLAHHIQVQRQHGGGGGSVALDRFKRSKKMMVRVPLREGRTLHHDAKGRWGAGKVILRSAPPGTGVIAGGPMRAVLESLGVQDVVAKSTGSSNPYNMVRATFEALKAQNSPRTVAAKRGIKVADLVERRQDGASSPEAIES